MVDKLARLTAEQRSNFVAYLDGELNEDEAQRIEQLLAQNEVARHDMESLASTWEMLDTLPRVKASDEFTQNTLATVKMADAQRQWSEPEWMTEARRIGVRAIGWVLVMACGLGGYLLARSVPPTTTDAMIENYPLLKNFDSYEEVGSIEFLQKLQSNPEWQRRRVEFGQGGR